MAGIGDAWGTREELLHPRDKHGRFRSKWKMAEGVVNKITSFLSAFRPRTFQSDQQAAQYTQNLGGKKRFSLGEIARLHADFNPAQEDLRDGIADEPSTKKFVAMMDSHAIDLPDDVIVSRVVGPDAFGLTPETMNAPDGGLEDFTGKKIADRGYSATNLGTPLGAGSGQITMSIAVPKGTKATFTGQGGNDRTMYLQRHQELRVTKVKPDGRGGYYVLAVAEGTGTDTPEPLGGHVGSGRPKNREDAVRALQEGQARNMKAEGEEPSNVPTPIGDGGMPAQDNNAAPAPAQALPDGTQPRNEPVHAESIGGGPAAPAAPAAVPSPREAAAPAAPAGPPPVAGPPLEDADVAKLRQRREARTRYQAIADRVPLGNAGAELHELVGKKASNKVIAEHIRAYATGPAMAEVHKDQKDRVRHELERVAEAFEQDKPTLGKQRMANHLKQNSIQLQHEDRVGKNVAFDEATMESVGDIPEDGQVEVIKPAVLAEGTVLEKAVVTAPTRKTRKPPTRKVQEPGAPNELQDRIVERAAKIEGEPKTPFEHGVKEQAARIQQERAARAGSVPKASTTSSDDEILARAQKMGPPKNDEDRKLLDQAAEISTRRNAESIERRQNGTATLEEAPIKAFSRPSESAPVKKATAPAVKKAAPAKKAAPVKKTGPNAVEQANLDAEQDVTNEEQLKRWSDAAGEAPNLPELHEAMLQQTAEQLRNRELTKAKAAEQLRDIARDRNTPADDYLRKVADIVEKGTPVKRAPRKAAVSSPADEELKGLFDGKKPTVADLKKYVADNGIEMGAGRKLRQDYVDKVLESKKGGVPSAPEVPKVTEPPVKKAVKKAAKAAVPAAKLTQSEQQAQDAAIHALIEGAERRRPGAKQGILDGATPEERKEIEASLNRFEELDKAMKAGRPEPKGTAAEAGSTVIEDAAASSLVDLTRRRGVEAQIRADMTPEQLKLVDEAVARHKARMEGRQGMAEARKMVADAKKERAAAEKPPIVAPTNAGNRPKRLRDVQTGDVVIWDDPSGDGAPLLGRVTREPGKGVMVDWSGGRREHVTGAALQREGSTRVASPEEIAALGPIQPTIGVPAKMVAEKPPVVPGEITDRTTIPELRKIAAERGVDLKGARLKADIRKRIDDAGPAAPPVKKAAPRKAASPNDSPVPRDTTKIPDAPRGTTPLSGDRATEFKQAWKDGKAGNKVTLEDHITGMQLRDVHDDLAEGRISPEQALTRVEDQLKDHKAQEALLEEKLRSPMEPFERKTAREKLERLRLGITNQEDASRFIRRYFAQEPTVTPKQFEAELPDQAKADLAKATPDDLRAEAKLAGLGDLKGESKDEVVKDLVQKIVAKKTAPAKKLAPKPVKAAPFSEPGKTDVRALGTGLAFTDEDKHYLKDVQDRLDGTNGHTKMTPQEAAARLEEQLAGGAGPAGMARTIAIGQNGDEEHDAAIVAKMAEYYDQSARLGELVGRLKAVPAPGTKPAKATDTTKLHDRIVDKATKDLAAATSMAQGHAALAGLTKPELVAIARSRGVPVGPKDTKAAIAENLTHAEVGRRLMDSAVSRAVSKAPAAPTELKYSTKATIPNKWGLDNREVAFHSDGELGQMLDSIGGEKMLEVDGDSLANVVGRLATDNVTGRKTQQETLDALERVKAQLPEGSRARAAMDYALKRLETPAKKVDIPDVAPAPIKTLAETLSRIPAARTPRPGATETEMDQVAKIAARFRDGQVGGHGMIAEIRHLQNQRHESNEGKFEIDRAIKKAAQELEELRKETKGEGLRLPKANGDQGSPAAGVEDLAARSRKVRTVAVAGEKPSKIRILGGSSNAARLTYPDGTQLVLKKQERQENHADVLGSLVGDAVGLRTAGTHIQGHDLYQEYLPGRVGSDVFSEMHDDLDQREALFASRTGKLIGILDVLLANGDRHSGNWIQDENGDLKPIDHGFAFGFGDIGGAYGSPFVQRFFTTPSPETFMPDLKDSISGINPADLARMEPRLRALQEQFKELGRESWYRAMMARYERLKAAAEKGWKG